MPGERVTVRNAEEVTLAISSARPVPATTVVQPSTVVTISGLNYYSVSGYLLRVSRG